MGQAPSRNIQTVHSLNKLQGQVYEDDSHQLHNDDDDHHHHQGKMRKTDYRQILSVPELSKVSKDINTRDKQGMTLLHRACEQGLWRTADLLLHLGADPSLTSLGNHGNTNALILAASGGHADCVRRLLAFGADSQLADSWGNTALFKAACYNHVDCVGELLRNGADPDVGNKWGALPIQYAAREGHHQVVSLLVEAGADVTAVGESSTPQALESALVRGHYRCFEPILDQTLNKQDPVISGGLLRSLLNRLISVPDEYRPGHVKMAELLVDRGADLDPETLRTLADRMKSGLDTNTEFSFVQVLLLSVYPDSTHSEVMAELFRTLSRSQHYGRRCVDLILNTGHRPRIEGIRDIATLASDDIRILEHELAKPRSLYDCSRLTVRKCLGKSIFQKVDALPLPRAVKDDIRLMPTLHRVSWLTKKPSRSVKVE